MNISMDMHEQQLCKCAEFVGKEVKLKIPLLPCLIFFLLVVLLFFFCFSFTIFFHLYFQGIPDHLIFIRQFNYAHANLCVPKHTQLIKNKTIYCKFASRMSPPFSDFEDGQILIMIWQTIIKCTFRVQVDRRVLCVRC